MFSVYIVDDEKLVADDLIASIPWLENGFEVIGHNTNPLAAIAEIAGRKPDIVFTDLKMPACDGIELIRRCRENGVDAGFVILSAYEDFQASREFFRLGGIDYITKPLDQDQAGFVLEQLSRRMAGMNKQAPAARFTPSHSKGFDDVVAYVTSNFSRKHTLKDLSDRFNVNPTYICDLFAKHFQSTLIIFVTNLRMTEASRLISETDTPLKEIAIFCGYPDYYYFCKVFKSHFGRSPSRHREGNR